MSALPDATSRADTMERALRTLSLSKKKGLDGTCPKIMRRASRDSMAALTYLLMGMECWAILPLQCMMVLIALIPKPLGGERPIAVLSYFYRGVGKSGAAEVRLFEADKAGPWDAAVAGGGP